jgi:hypothetical protein
MISPHRRWHTILSDLSDRDRSASSFEALDVDDRAWVKQTLAGTG